MLTDFAGRTHIGLRRKENQDGFLSEEFSSSTGKSLVCIAVADGMGGHDEGRKASSEAILSVRERLEQFLAEEGSDQGPLESWLEGIELDAHARVGKIAAADQTVGTTLTVALIRDARCVIGHVGDSRVYALKAGKFEQLTSDHTWEQYALDRNQENQYGKALRQAIGVGVSVEPDAFEVTLHSGDSILLCSDGLYKMVPEPEIAAILMRSKDAAEGCELLIQAALDKGGKDNVAVCIARAGEPKSARRFGSRHFRVAIGILFGLMAVFLTWYLFRLLG